MERRFETGCVASARDLSPGFRNVTIVSASLAGSAFTPTRSMPFSVGVSR